MASSSQVATCSLKDSRVDWARACAARGREKASNSSASPGDGLSRSPSWPRSPSCATWRPLSGPSGRQHRSVDRTRPSASGQGYVGIDASQTSGSSGPPRSKRPRVGHSKRSETGNISGPGGASKPISEHVNLFRPNVNTCFRNASRRAFFSSSVSAYEPQPFPTLHRSPYCLHRFPRWSTDSEQTLPQG